jgi:hypothetical protein
MNPRVVGTRGLKEVQGQGPLRADSFSIGAGGGWTARHEPCKWWTLATSLKKAGMTYLLRTSELNKYR